MSWPEGPPGQGTERTINHRSINKGHGRPEHTIPRPRSSRINRSLPGGWEKKLNFSRERPVKNQ